LKLHWAIRAASIILGQELPINIVKNRIENMFKKAARQDKNVDLLI